MTWGEFKRAVEDQGVKDDDEIFYIDVHLPAVVRVQREEDRLVNRGGVAYVAETGRSIRVTG